MVEQIYKIRRNEDGFIVAQDVRDIIDLALKHNIIQGVKNDYIFVYHQESLIDPEQCPEGWYKDDYEMVIQEIMRSDEGFNCILNALSENNILFVPTLTTSALDFMREFRKELNKEDK